jgi:hypothetical protein
MCASAAVVVELDRNELNLRHRFGSDAVAANGLIGRRDALSAFLHREGLSLKRKEE